MTSLYRIFAILLLATAPFGQASAEKAVNEKPFDVESGIIEKKKSVTNAVIKMQAVETMYFKEWGRVRASIITETTSNKYVKGEQVVRKFSLVEGSTLTVVDLDANTGTRMENPMAQSLGSMSQQQMTDMSDKMADATNTKTKPAGEVTVAGKPCRVTEAVTAMGASSLTTTTYMWKNIVLKLESTGMGTDTFEEAISVKTDVAIPEDKFKLPKGAKIADVKMP